MSSPGYFYGDPTQNNDIQQRMRMAQALMGNQGAQGAYGGLANAGNSLLGALTYRNAQDDARKQQGLVAPSPAGPVQTAVTNQKSWNPQTGQLYSLGSSLP